MNDERKILVDRVNSLVNGAFEKELLFFLEEYKKTTKGFLRSFKIDIMEDRVMSLINSVKQDNA